MNNKKDRRNMVEKQRKRIKIREYKEQKERRVNEIKNRKKEKERREKEKENGEIVMTGGKCEQSKRKSGDEK